MVVERHRWSRAEAESLVRDFEQSGLSRKAFCSAHSIALHTLDCYRARYRTRRATRTAHELLPVDLISASPVSGGLHLELVNGRRIVVEAGFDVSHLKRLIAVLESRGDVRLGRGNVRLRCHRKHGYADRVRRPVWQDPRCTGVRS